MIKFDDLKKIDIMLTSRQVRLSYYLLQNSHATIQMLQKCRLYTLT